MAQDAAVGRRLFLIEVMNLQWRAARVSGCYGLSYLPEEGMWLSTLPLKSLYPEQIPPSSPPGTTSATWQLLRTSIMVGLVTGDGPRVCAGVDLGCCN